MSETHETIHLEKTQAGCGLCETYTAREAAKPVVVLACEGACLRGELARLAANALCDEVAPERTARLCLGGAFTQDTGQRALARNAPRVVAVEGCPIACGSRMMRAVLPDLAPEVFYVHRMARFDPRLFSIREMPEADRARHAAALARMIGAILAQRT